MNISKERMDALYPVDHDYLGYTYEETVKFETINAKDLYRGNLGLCAEGMSPGDLIPYR